MWRWGVVFLPIPANEGTISVPCVYLSVIASILKELTGVKFCMGIDINNILNEVAEQGHRLLVNGCQVENVILIFSFCIGFMCRFMLSYKSLNILMFSRNVYNVLFSIFMSFLWTSIGNDRSVLSVEGPFFQDTCLYHNLSSSSKSASWQLMSSLIQWYR